MRKVAFHTLGCKVNQYESAAIANMFREQDYEIVDEQEYADVYVINTCTVTAVADKKSRQYIRRMKKLNPNSIIAVTGCYVQIKPEEVAAIDGVDIVAGVNNKGDIVNLVEKRYLENRAEENEEVQRENGYQKISDLNTFVELGPVASTEDRTRAYIKIQEGCNRFCSYCVIPYARGPVRSRPIENIVKEAKILIESGYKEIVLTGINAAQYDMEERDLFTAAADDAARVNGKMLSEEVFGIEKVIAAISELHGDFRIRLSSLEPAVVNSEYVKRLFKYDKLCHHMHMSAQSGSDRILKAMNRPYDSDGYYDLVNTLFDFDPCYGISTDIIVGFPGEKEPDFAESCEMVSECSFVKTHIFKYSKRPLTKAAQMPQQVSPQIKNERADTLKEYAAKAREAFCQINLAAAEEGRSERLLIEEIVTFSNDEASSSRKTAKIGDAVKYYAGYTGNYIRAYVPVSGQSVMEKDSGEAAAVNQFREVRLISSFRDGMLAEFVI